MKKLSIFCSSIFVSLLMSAQVKPVKNTAENSFCKVLSKVMSNASDNFIKIQVGQADDPQLTIYYSTGNGLGETTGWSTSVDFPGAIESFIEEYTMDIDENTALYNPYSACFGSFKTKVEATNKLNSIKKQLTVCLKGYKVRILKSSVSLTGHFYVYHEFTGKAGNLSSQTIILEIKKSSDRPLYEVFLRVKGLNSEPTSLRPLAEWKKGWEALSALITENNEDKSIQGQEIRSVKIGEQTWMAENLNTSTFRNGDPIPQAMSWTDWDRAAEEEKPAWCYYGYDPENGKKYGKLYNWYAVNDPRGLAPTGWHIPNAFNWESLKFFLGKDSGLKMKSTSGWPQNANGNNSSGFTGLPGGVQNGGYMDPGKWGCWWSTTRAVSFLMPNTKDRDCYCLSYEKEELDSYSKSLREGQSVRCIKD